MKNFWLDRRGPKKTKVNIWLGASITGGEEELLSTSEFVSELFFTDGTAKMNVPQEINQMLWDHRIGQALCKRNDPVVWAATYPWLSIEFAKAQWTPPKGHKLLKKGEHPYLEFFIKEDKPDPRTQGSCPIVLGTLAGMVRTCVEPVIKKKLTQLQSD